MHTALFDAVTFDPVRHEAELKFPPAGANYLIFFTPRSGSSWLTDTIKATRQLGEPNEWFNPEFVPEIASVLNANTPARLVEVLRRSQAPGGVFGAEVTYLQMAAVFGTSDQFLSLYPPLSCTFFLVREDIVEQAVSLAKSVATNVFHSANSSPREIETADRSFKYDRQRIKDWLIDIARQEQSCEALFLEHAMEPVRLSYERTTAAGEKAVVDFFGRTLGVETTNHASQPNGHRKIGTTKNSEYAARFRYENPALVAQIESGRRLTLDRLASLAELTGAPPRPSGFDSLA